VISVQPYLDPVAYTGKSVPVFDQNFNVDKFFFETPFGLKGGGQTDSLADQYKRKTILETERVFPYVNKRIRIRSKREIILSPIENAIELVEGRCEALLTEINSTLPSTKTLQQVLQGSVLAQVNAGAIHICEVFLGKDSGFPKEMIIKLREAISKFLMLCGRAVELNERLIKDDQLEFQRKLQQGYLDIEQKIKKNWGIIPASPSLMNVLSINSPSSNTKRIAGNHSSTPGKAITSESNGMKRRSWNSKKSIDGVNSLTEGGNGGASDSPKTFRTLKRSVKKVSAEM